MSFSIDISKDNFNQEVIEASHHTPVLVDFWATWCGPCKSLMPVLEKLVLEYAGKFKLAKVEVDQQQNLATQFAIRSVPTVKIVKAGEVVDEFAGALAEDQIRTLINKHITATENSAMQDAIEAYQRGEESIALEMMQQVLLNEPTNPIVRIEFANMLMREKRFDDARDLLNSLNADEKNIPTALALFGQLDSIDAVMSAPDIEELLQTIEKDPANLKAREQLCAHYKLRGDYAAAMDQLLEIVRKDRNYNDDAGRKELLKIFEVLGADHALTGQYRRKLALMLN